MFFKDLTRVEQIEERERLRDRLASLGEMAAGIAHELKNPLAGIEVMAGLLRRQVADSKDAQSLLADILSEAKLANAIVVEMLEFVRPVRLQVERTDIADVLQQSVTMAESKAPRGDVDGGDGPASRAADDRGRSPSAVPGVHQSDGQRVRGARRQRTHRDFGADERDRGRSGVCRRPPADAGGRRRRRRRRARACRRKLTDKIFNPFFTTKVTGHRARPRRSCGRSSTRTTGGST